MTDSNNRTIESYEEGFNKYVQTAPNNRGEAVEAWIDTSLKELPPSAAILEIGSAYGRDANIIEEKGYRVEKTDATKAFVDILQQTDPTAHVLNILTDELVHQYDLIVANAVFLHFDDKETVRAVRKVFNALKTGGKFAFTLKEGSGEAWQENKGMKPRYFNFWSKEAITELLISAGFSHVDAWIDASDNANVSWIMIITKK